MRMRDVYNVHVVTQAPQPTTDDQPIMPEYDGLSADYARIILSCKEHLYYAQNYASIIYQGLLKCR